MQYDIFLSYSGRNIEWATRLYERLRRFHVAGRRLSIFFAPAAISVGESIPRVLGDALASSTHLLIVASPDWVSSEWCRLEGEIASWIDPSSVRRVVLPLLLKDCELPTLLRHIRYIDFRNDTMYESSLHELVDAVRAGVSKASESSIWQRERDAILNEPILPWMGFGGPNFDFLWPEMIISPLVWTRKHPSPQLRLSNWVGTYVPSAGSCVAVVGEPGAGKTTALRSLLLSDDRRLPKRRAYLHFRDLTAKLDALISRCEDDSSVLGVLIDGLDEAGSDRMVEIAAGLCRLREVNAALIIGSRLDFFDRQYSAIKAGIPNLVEVLELASWQDDDILDFTRRYAERIGQAELSDAVEGLLMRIYGARSMLGNPMRLTLLLYLMATGANVNIIDLEQPYSLYDTFYREWIRKERGRGTGGFHPASIRAAHTEVAHRLNQFKGEVVSLAELLAEMPVGLSGDDIARLSSDTGFSGLLNIRLNNSDNLVVSSFRHETLGEFLIANDILQSFGGTSDQLRRALRVTMTHDVNSFVRSGLLVASRATVHGYFSNLADKYQELLPDNGQSLEESTETDKAEKLRQQIIYYIGRMPLDSFPDILRQAFHSEPRPLLRRAAALGAILHGDFDIEREYLGLLDTLPEALLNRSVQMVNFGDVHADIYTFKDNGQDWSRTRTAIYDRLQGGSVRDIRLRWWDIRTLRSFYMSRRYRDELTVRERAVLRDVSLFDDTSMERSAFLQQEHELLLRELADAGVL